MTISKGKKQLLDVLLEIMGIVIILTCFLILAINYSYLPDFLPRHYGFDGKPDAFAGKGIVWVLPILGFFLYLILGLISSFPVLINLPFKPKPEYLEFHQRRYSRMIRILNLVMVCIFAYLTFQSVQIGLGNQTRLHEYFGLISLVLLLGIPLIYVVPDMIKTSKEN